MENGFLIGLPPADPGIMSAFGGLLVDRSASS